MKRSKLSVTAPLPPGSMPPTSTWYAVPRCFACDDAIKSHRFSTSLLQGHTHYTHSSIPGKLGEYIGEGFVIVVTSEDALCRTCMNLLNTMDRLEEELKDHRNKLVGNLRRKYGLDPGGTQATTKLTRKPVTKVIEDDDIVEIQSDEEWTPYNKKRKVTPSAFPRTKTLTCNVCKMEFIDLNRFMTHLKMHREAAQQPKEEIPSSNVGEAFKSFKCGCCSLSFDKKEALATHMKQHTGDQLLNRPTPSIGNAVSLMRSNLSTNSSNGSKLFPKPTSQTVVEMKLIMDAGQKKSSTQSPPLEKPVTVTKVTDKDPGGKVCLLALWNSGSCSDHADCQNPSCGSEFHPKTTINVQQTSQAVVTQKEKITPKIVVRQSQDSLEMPVVSQAQFQIATSVGQQSNLALVPSISQASTHVITLPHSVTTQTQLPVNISGSTQHIVVSIPNQSNVNYNIPTQQPSKLALENQEIILNTSDNNPPEALAEDAQPSDVNQKIQVLPSVNFNDKSSNNFQAQLPDQTLNSAVSENKPSKSMPSLDDDIVGTASTTAGNVEMENVPIVNVGGSEAVADETDWYLASEQSNAVLEAPHTLWGQDYSQDGGKGAIDQLDGATRFCSALSFDAREQSDSVDENEKSDYFSSRYVVDSEMRQVAQELSNALDAAFKT